MGLLRADVKIHGFVSCPIGMPALRTQPLHLQETHAVCGEAYGQHQPASHLNVDPPGRQQTIHLMPWRAETSCLCQRMPKGQTCVQNKWLLLC